MAEQFHFDPDTYLAIVRAEVPDYEQLQEIVADAAGEVAAVAILDLGTGTGEILRHVAQRHPTARLTGVDESDRMLANARKVVPSADCIRCGEPPRDRSIVISALAVHHPTRTKGRCSASQLDSPGGRFVLADVIVPDDRPTR
jgi:tRNA (cmo5U34)-methyltransferase